MKDSSKAIQITVVVLGLVVVALLVALLYSGRQAAQRIEQDHVNIITLSNQVQNTVADLDEHKSVITNLVADLTARAADIQVLSNSLVITKVNLDEAQGSLKTAQAELARRDEAISKLEAHNLALEANAAELEASLTNLNNQIMEIAQKLTVTEGDKTALTAELQRVLAEKAQLENGFSDLTTLQAQVKKIKRDENMARRLAQIQSGYPPAIEIKGAEKQVQSFRPPPPRPVSTKSSDLNVEIGSDGSLKVIPPINRGATR